MKARLAPHRRCALVGFAVATWLAASVSPASATTCTDVCGSSSGNCSIGSLKTVEDGSVLDCHGRNVTITGFGKLRVTDGDLTLLANDLTILQGSNGIILAEEGSEGAIGEINIQLTGNLALNGKIRANGNHGGGTISIKADGNISIPDDGDDGIEADGTDSGASGGEVSLEADGTTTISDPIHVEGATYGANSGGTIEIRSGGTITTGTTGHLSAGGRDLGGGSIRLSSTGGDVILGEHLVADGRSATGKGGEIEVTAAGKVQVSQYIEARGGVNAGGGTGAGGQVTLEAGCGGVVMDPNGDITVTGGELTSGQRGGSFEIDSVGPVTMAAGVTIDTHGRAPGADAGSVQISTRSTLTADAILIDAEGSSASGGHGRGGKVDLTACRAEVKASAVIDARGYSGGSITIYAQNSPAATGTEPLLVHTGASLRAVGTATARNGSTVLRAHSLKQGICSNNNAVACWLDTDCTAGCQTGDCLYANPDTEGLATQFDLVADRAELPGTGASCATACQ